MALNLPRIDKSAVAGTSIVLGYSKGPSSSSYHEQFELGRPAAPKPASRNYELVHGSEIFHPTESKYPQSVAQASWGEKSPKMTKLIYQHREKELKHIVGIHSQNSVPFRYHADVESLDAREANISQAKLDYADRHHILDKWINIQMSDICKLPSISKHCARQAQNSSRGPHSEAKTQFQWPEHDKNKIFRVKFRKRSY